MITLWVYSYLAVKERQDLVPGLDVHLGEAGGGQDEAAEDHHNYQAAQQSLQTNELAQTIEGCIQ